jgi:uncharacterized protein (DUF2126 family)
VAWFWREPQHGSLVRWGTALHDRFMLEHCVWEDFLGVLEELRGAGYDFAPDWFHAQREFRFPFYGAVTYGGVNLELRHALEPWHVLGEDTTAGVTARFVTSVERLQVKVEGLNASHVVTCNGRRIPLTSTGRSASTSPAYASKRGSYRRAAADDRCPPSRSISSTLSRRPPGGCVYHVAHPGGCNYENRSGQLYEAEARRLARFRTAIRRGRVTSPRKNARSNTR